MSKELVKNLLKSSSFYVLNKALIKSIGLTETAVLSFLSESESMFEDDWFFVIADKIQTELNIGRRPYDSALANLSSREIIETRLFGMPSKKYFRINYDIVERLIGEQACLSETYNQGCAKCTSKVVQNVQTSLYEMDNYKEHIDKEPINKEPINKKRKIKESPFGIDDTTGEPLSMDDIVQYWNTRTANVFPALRGANATRQKQTASIISTYGIQEFYRAIDVAMTSGFLRGDKGWQMTFDWFIKESNFIKVLEGNYKDKGNGTNQSSGQAGEPDLSKLTDQQRILYYAKQYKQSCSGGQG